jgi:hypothetical protein
LDNAHFDGEVCFPSGSGLTFGNNMKNNSKKILAVILVLTVSTLLQSCKQDPDLTKPAKQLLKKTKSIEFFGGDMYLDGGSLGFFFTTDKNEEFVVFLPVSCMDRTNIVNGSQLVEITTEQSFHYESPFPVARNSKEEAHLLELLSEARDEEADPEKQNYLNTLHMIVKRRNFRWKEYYEPAKGKSLIQPVEFAFNESLTIGSEQIK